MNDLKFRPIEELSYEEALQELEELIKTLESGDNDLQTTLLHFERGQKLASYCISLLDDAEKKVDRLMKGEDESS